MSVVITCKYMGNMIVRLTYLVAGENIRILTPVLSPYNSTQKYKIINLLVCCAATYYMN
jgi:hypothetical protein